MNIISRAQWGARSPTSRVTGDTVTETFLHHSVGYGSGGASYMRQMQNQHMDTNGWSDIAYNHVIDPKTLTVYEGRGWGVRPGAQKSYNKNTWAVCIMGHFSIWKPAQFPGLLELIAELIAFGDSLGRIPRVLTGGHRDAPNATTTCPGNNLYPAIPLIRQFLEEQDMPLNDADLAAIKATVEDVLGGKRITLPRAGDTFDRFGNLGIVNSVWHATSGNIKLVNLLRATHDAAVKASQPVDPAAIADAIIADVGADLAGQVVDEMSARLSL